MKLSGLKSSPIRLPLMLSIVPGSRSMRRALGTYLPPENMLETYTVTAVIRNCNQIKQNKSLTMCLIEVDIDPFQLQGTVAFIDARCIEPMFITDDFPKLLSQMQRTNERTDYTNVCIPSLKLKPNIILCPQR